MRTFSRLRALSIQTRRRRENMSSLTHTLIVLTSRELNDEIIKKCFCPRTSTKEKTPQKSLAVLKTARGRLQFDFFTRVYSVFFFIPLRNARCHVLEIQKHITARHSAFNSLHNAFSFLFCTYARVPACVAGVPRAACVRHVLCVLWWRSVVEVDALCCLE